MQTALDSLLPELQGKGLRIDKLISNEKWNSFAWGDNTKKKKGSYRIFMTPYGAEISFHNWRDDTQNFSLRLSDRTLSEDEIAEHKKRIDEIREIENKKKAIRWETAALEAERQWMMANESFHHPYLLKKNLKNSYGTRVSIYHSLHIPLRDVEGKLWGLQSVSEDGSRKMNVSGMKLEGNFHLIGTIENGRPLFFCEGFATAATIFESTGMSAVCCFGPRFTAVAQNIKKKFPTVECIFAGDADPAGKKGSREASSQVGGLWIIPKFRSPHPDYTDWNDLRDLEGEIELKNQIENYKVESKNAYTMKQDWMSQYLERHEVQYEYSGKIRAGSEHIKLTEFLAQMFLDSDREGLKLSDRMISSFVTVWIASRKRQIWNETIQKIDHFDPSGIEELKIFMKAITGRAKAEEIAVMLHFIQQCKRKAFGKKVEHHMMPVLVGQTGGGKSESVERLLDFISPLWTKSSLDVCSDAREANLFEDCLVLNMDEMQKAERTDLAGLKRTITSSSLTFRVLKTNFHETVHNRSTLIGSSNEPLDYLIKDATSIRRFYAIQTLDKDPLQKNWEIINKIDAGKIWHAIDASSPCPILGLMETIREDQEEMRFQSDVELWIEHDQVMRDEKCQTANSEIIKRFHKFCESQGKKFLPEMAFVSKELARLGFKRSRSKFTRGFELSFGSQFASEGPSYSN